RMNPIAALVARFARRRPLVSTIAAAMLATFAGAAPIAAADERFHGRIPEAGAYTVEKNIAYTRSGDRDVVLDLYRPARFARGARLPLVIFVNTNANPQRDHPIY